MPSTQHSSKRPQLPTLVQPIVIVGIAICLLSSCAPKASHYGFLTMLGNDTISVESVSRSGNTLTIDGVDRFPRVEVRHAKVDLNDDGSIKHLVMQIHTPSEPAGQRDRKVVADVANNKVHLTKTDSTGTIVRDFANDGKLVVAHVQQMYSLYELYFTAALKQQAKTKAAPGSPVQLRQFYIDREFDNFPLAHATVTPLGNGKATITHDWLSGTGEATMDSSNNLLSYTGTHTTYDVRVKRLNAGLDTKSISDRFVAIESAAGNVKSLSVRDTVRSNIGDAIFTIDYGSPLMRGRTLLGGVIPYDMVWRTGANAATQFTSSMPIKLAGLEVPAGTYTLFTAPHMNGVELIVNKEHGQWGTSYKRSLNLGIAKMESETISTPVEKFSITIAPLDKQHGQLVFEWGNFRWIAPIEVE